MNKTHSPVSVTFVLPGDNRSGGVRVTGIMANLLLDRGHRVRIVHPYPKFFDQAKIKRIIQKLRRVQQGETGWLHLFRGKIECYRQLDELSFDAKEIVIAVGSFMVADVRAMKKPVIKVRYNHGFPFRPDINQQRAWDGEMTTITVSSTLVSRLEELSGNKVAAIIPNGIDTSQYFEEQYIEHVGIGAIYSAHPNKAPEDMINLLEKAKSQWAHIPQHVFSAEQMPKGLEHTNYTRYPAIEQARRIYNSCKIWLLTSYTEGLPGPVLEAMACGCIVISTDNDGSLEILKHEENGLIVPKGNLSAFIEQIDRVFRDETLAEKLLKGASATVQNFTWQNASQKMDDFLQTVQSEFFNK